MIQIIGELAERNRGDGFGWRDRLLVEGVGWKTSARSLALAEMARKIGRGDGRGIGPVNLGNIGGMLL